MKIKALLFTAFFTQLLYCQSSFTELDLNIELNNLDLTKQKWVEFNNYKFEFPKIEPKASYFSIYDKNIGFSNNYYVTDKEMKFVNFNTNPTNNFLGTKKDSFNPSGTDYVWAALALGIFESIFNK